MTITTSHPASVYGVPVVLDGAGRLIDTPAGLAAARRVLGLNTTGLGRLLGFSPRTVEGWEQGRRPVPTRVLYQMSELLTRSGP